MDDRRRRDARPGVQRLIIVHSSQSSLSDEILSCEGEEEEEEEASSLIYGAVMSGKLMRLNPEEFARFCELRQKDRDGDGFCLVSMENEREPCNLEMIQLVSGTLRSISAEQQEINEYRCNESPMLAIRLLVSTLYRGIMPNYETFRRNDFCHLIFELNIVFLMKFCNSTGVLGTNLMQIQKIYEETSSISDEESVREDSPEEEEEEDANYGAARLAEQEEESCKDSLPFVVVNGYKYLLGKRHDKDCYYYCQWRRKGEHANCKTKNYCRASLVINRETQQMRFISPTHLESCVRVEPTGQTQELAVRIQIEKMIADHMTTTQIHQQLMKLEREGAITIPTSVNRAYIDRLVRQHQRKSGPVVAKSMFTSEQAKLDDCCFIQLECHIPFLVILATSMSVAAAEVSSEIFIGKIRSEGPDRKRVAVVLYKAIDRKTQETSFQAMAWIIFDKHLEDRDGSFFRAIVRYLQWTGNNLRIITYDMDEKEECFCRSLLNTTTIGYINGVKNRTTKVSYLRSVHGILKKLQGLAEYNDLAILKQVPEMTSNQIRETVDDLERLTNAGRRALLKWKSLFSVKISHISRGQIACDLGRNNISKWLATVKLEESWISLLNQLKYLHKATYFPDNEAPYEE